MASITKSINTSNSVKTTKTIKSDKSNISKSSNNVSTTNEYPQYDFSIFIPSIFNNLEDQIVIDTFNTLFGSECVEKVDFWVPPTYKGEIKYKMAFVHFNNMPVNDITNNFKKSIGEGKEIRIHYTDKYFWKCVMNKKSNKPTSSAEEKTKFVPKMTIGTVVPNVQNDKNKSWGDIEDEEENNCAAEKNDDESDDEE